MDMTESVTIRPATLDDHDAVTEITANTWPDREGGDYLGRVYPEWLEAGDHPKRTLVADVDGRAVAIAQCVMLSATEAWGQGLRVHPDFRNQGLSHRLTRELFEWAIDSGATVVRVMVFAWNVAGLGQARSTGYRPVGSFRFVDVTPAESPGALDRLSDRDRFPDVVSADVVADPDVAWRTYQGSQADRYLGGLGMSPYESWAMQEVSPSLLHDRPDDAVIAVATDRGETGMSYRARTFDRTDDDGNDLLIAEYGVATWSDITAGAAVFDAIAADAAAIGADRTRVVVPEDATLISDAAYLGGSLDDTPDFVLAADLSHGSPLSRH